jgi:hypothetical protein
MQKLDAGDIVRIADAGYEMLIIGSADEAPADHWLNFTWFCAWEDGHYLFEEIFAERDLILVRRERRRVPRGGNLDFPVRPSR